MDALERLRAQARQQLGFYPTPLEELGRLRVALGERAPRLLVKRDDYTGFALGGNKVRKLEYELAFWGGGHVLQFAWTLLLLVAWLLLADASGVRVPISPRVVAPAQPGLFPGLLDRRAIRLRRD